MASLSEKLRRERELRGISLKQISEDTKIGVRFLEALEEDRLELIPGEFYRRSYLRAYAKYLGLDEDRAVNAYAYSQDKKPESEAERTTESQSVGTWILWPVLGAVLLIATVFVLRSRSEMPPEPLGSPEPAVGTTPLEPAEDTVSEPPPASAAVAPPVLSPRTPEPEGTTPDLEDGAIRLVVSVGESCWLEIEADGEVVTTGLKEEGYRREFTASEEVRLWLGNAGGVSLWVNGRPVRSLGRPGQVRRDVSITPDNFMDYVGDDVS